MRSMTLWFTLCLVTALVFAAPASAVPREANFEREQTAFDGWLSWLEGVWAALAGEPPTTDDPQDQSESPHEPQHGGGGEDGDPDRGTLDPNG
ncbi:MAG: hypothetical protein AAF481_03375 [Acidobacteriota bacterium]